MLEAARRATYQRKNWTVPKDYSAIFDVLRITFKLAEETDELVNINRNEIDPARMRRMSVAPVAKNVFVFNLVSLNYQDRENYNFTRYLRDSAMKLIASLHNEKKSWS